MPDEIDRLKAALAHYASPYHWSAGEVPGHIYAHDDAGCLARKTLGLPGRLHRLDEFEAEAECRRIMAAGAE